MDHPQYPQERKDTNGKAIASMVLGILSLIIPYVGFILGIIAIVLSRKANREIAAYNQAGKGMSTAGLVCGIIGTALYGIIIILAIIALVVYSASYGM